MRRVATARSRRPADARDSGMRHATAAGALALALLAWLPPAQADFGRYVPYAQQRYEDDGGRRGSRSERYERRQERRQERESLTADERRELNRDLQRANREIYRKGRER